MDDFTQLVIGIICVTLGVYLFIQGYRIVILRKEVLIFIIKFYIWLNLLINGERGAEKYKSEQLKPKTQLYDGFSYIVIGLIVLVLGFLLLLTLFVDLYINL